MHESDCHQHPLNVTMCYNNSHSVQSRHSNSTITFSIKSSCLCFYSLLFFLYIFCLQLLSSGHFYPITCRNPITGSAVVVEILTILYMSSVNLIQSEGGKSITSKHTAGWLSKWEKIGNAYRPPPQLLFYSPEYGEILQTLFLTTEPDVFSILMEWATLN